jgi:hypothetical protein
MSRQGKDRPAFVARLFDPPATHDTDLEDFRVGQPNADPLIHLQLDGCEEADSAARGFAPMNASHKMTISSPK